MAITKIKRADVPTIKKKLLIKQKGICPICGKDMTRVAPANIVLDHDHITGIVRAAIHRGCNRVEGQVLNSAMRWGKATSKREAIKVIENLVTFWKLHQVNQTEWIYHNHKTPSEKRELYNKRRRLLAKRKRRELK